jgi:hypothetical protein
VEPLNTPRASTSVSTQGSTAIRDTLPADAGNFYRGGRVIERDLLLFFVDKRWFEIFRLVYLTAIEATYVIDAVPPGKHLGFSVVARTFHSQTSPF